MRTFRHAALPVLAVALLLTGCGGGGGAAAPSTTGVSLEPTPAAATESKAPVEPVAQRAVSLAKGKLTVYAEADSTSKVVTKLADKTPLGSPRVLLVTKTQPGWVQVSLPVRPNGSTGWIEADSVRVEPVFGKIEVNLSNRTLTLLQNGSTVATSTVAIGSTKNPTPTGDFYVVDRVKPSNPNGAYGAMALGLSAHSDTLSEFGNGDGQIGIHGTNEKDSIGKNVSHGCVRVPDSLTDALSGVPLGTPVTIS
jgi:lipoprotein-anchoring transpeptidase ErfK/SrfK